MGKKSSSWRATEEFGVKECAEVLKKHIKKKAFLVYAEDISQGKMDCAKIKERSVV